MVNAKDVQLCVVAELTHNHRKTTRCAFTGIPQLSVHGTWRIFSTAVDCFGAGVNFSNMHHTLTCLAFPIAESRFRALSNFGFSIRE